MSWKYFVAEFIAIFFSQCVYKTVLNLKVGVELYLNIESYNELKLQTFLLGSILM